MWIKKRSLHDPPKKSVKNERLFFKALNNIVIYHSC